MAWVGSSHGEEAGDGEKGGETHCEDESVSERLRAWNSSWW
jgi:hypothetical protein